jgi:hypothetical protein
MTVTVLITRNKRDVHRLIDTPHSVGPTFEAHRREPATRKSIALGISQRAGSRPVQRPSWVEASALPRRFSQRMQNYISEELTHFVGRSLPSDEERLNLLIAILRNGELLDPRYKTKRDHPIFHFDVEDKQDGIQRHNYMPEPYFEVRENGPVGANEFVAPEMVCFCDIPVDQLAIHTKKYSSFGLAFSKPFGTGQGANPVYYVAKSAAAPLRLISPDGRYADFFESDDRNTLLSAKQDRVTFFEKLKASTLELIARYSVGLQERFLKYKRGQDDPKERRAELLALVEFMMGTFCYVHGQVKVFDASLASDDPNNFYMEREWRVIGRVRFSLEDVARVLLPAGLGDRFRREVPEFKGTITEL